jgi:hypothetical protein
VEKYAIETCLAPASRILLTLQQTGLLNIHGGGNKTGDLSDVARWRQKPSMLLFEPNS